MLRKTPEYNANIYVSKINLTPTVTPEDTRGIPGVRRDEINFHLENVKYGKAPNANGSIIDILKNTEKKFHKILTQLFSQCIHKRKVSHNFNLGIIILLYKNIIKTSTIIALPHYSRGSTNYSQKYV